MYLGEVSWLTLALLTLNNKKDLATSHTTHSFSSTNQKQAGSPGPIRNVKFSNEFFAILSLEIMIVEINSTKVNQYNLQQAGCNFRLQS